MGISDLPLSADEVEAYIKTIQLSGDPGEFKDLRDLIAAHIRTFAQHVRGTYYLQPQKACDTGHSDIRPGDIVEVVDVDKLGTYCMRRGLFGTVSYLKGDQAWVDSDGYTRRVGRMQPVSFKGFFPISHLKLGVRIDDEQDNKHPTAS